MKPKYPLLESDVQRLNNTFTYHRPQEGQPERYTAIREGAKQLSQTLLENCPRSRELSLAQTNLEDAVMWANAAIARNEGEGS